MSDSIVRFDDFYPGSTGTSGAAAAIGDILVVAVGYISTSHATASVSGVTISGGPNLVEQQFTTNGSASITILTGSVTVAGTPAFTVSVQSDVGFQAWIVRGCSSATADNANGASGVGNPLTAAGNPTVTSTLLISYLNEVANNFTSWNGSIASDAGPNGHVDAAGHQLSVPAGATTPGANVTSDAGNIISFIYLPVTASGPTITQQPSQQTIYEGQTATFSVSATTSGGALSYQWQKNGSDIGGATSSSYTTPTETYADNLAIFRVKVTDSNGTTTSNGAYLVVLQVGKLPWIQ